IREVRLEAPVADKKEGEVLKIGVFDGCLAVDVIGTMKGRGFSGTMKRHGFRGLETGHGVQRKHRAPGSIGCNTTPGKVRRGFKMNGQYGNTRCTVRNLKVVRVDQENNLLLVEGAVPGANGGMVMVRQTNSVVGLKKRAEALKRAQALKEKIAKAAAAAAAKK
ncbi:MAG: 50S ribosomal protein L3, partial [Planctomycetia bacterium]